MKSSKIWKIIWISGIYLLLFVILYLIVIYKVKWEHKDLNTYLYIYQCKKNICTSTTIQNEYYNKLLCENKQCPYITEIIDDILILKKEDKTWIYNYKKGEIIDNNYIQYRYINNNNFVVKDANNKYGIIDITGNIIIDAKYNYIDDYKNGYITYKENGLYGIINEETNYKIEPTYEEIKLINKEIFAGKINNKYQIHNYNNINNNNTKKYDYIYSYKDIILIINNKKIDILDSNLNSTLILKIDTFYEYKTEKERDSLKISVDKDNISFRVYINENDYTEYNYNVKFKKIA